MEDNAKAIVSKPIIGRTFWDFATELTRRLGIPILLGLLAFAGVVFGFYSFYKYKQAANLAAMQYISATRELGEMTKTIITNMTESFDALEAAKAETARAQRGLDEALKRQQQAEKARSDAEEKQRDAEVQLAELQRRSKLAVAVYDFLNEDLLATVDPSKTGQRDITVRQALYAAARRIDDKFMGEPLIESAIRATIGITFFNLGEYALAEPQLQNALRIRRSVLGDEHPDTLSFDEQLGRPIEPARPIRRGRAVALGRAECSAARAWGSSRGHFELKEEFGGTVSKPRPVRRCGAAVRRST